MHEGPEIASLSASSAPVQALHHIGFAVDSIEKAANSFAASTGCDWDGRIFDDSTQRAKVSFFGRPGERVLLELIQPNEAASPLTRFLARGGGLHHLCYEVDDIDSQLSLSRDQGSIVIQSPVPAVAFSGRKIAWVYTRQKLLLEFLERVTPD